MGVQVNRLRLMQISTLYQISDEGHSDEDPVMILLFWANYDLYIWMNTSGKTVLDSKKRREKRISSDSEEIDLRSKSPNDDTQKKGILVSLAISKLLLTSSAMMLRSLTLRSKISP